MAATIEIRLTDDTEGRGDEPPRKSPDAFDEGGPSGFGALPVPVFDPLTGRERPAPPPLPTPPAPPPAPEPLPTPPAPNPGGPFGASMDDIYGDNRGGPTGPDAVTHPVSAFDRPQSVIIMGPRPLPVTIAGGLPEGFGGGGGGIDDPTERGPKKRTLAQRAADGFNMLGEMAQAGGRGSAALAGNSAVGAMSGAIGAASAGLARLGPYGMAAAAAFQAAEKTIGALREAINAVVARAKEIGGFDGRIAAANAMADVRKLQTDIREAQRLGDKYGRVVDAQSKSEAMLSEIMNVIKGPLLELLANGMEFANKTLLGILEGINRLLPGAWPELTDLIATLKKIAAGDAVADLDRMVRAVLDAPLGIRAPAPVVPAAPFGAAFAPPALGAP